MNARLAATLVVLLALLGGGALYSRYQDRSREATNLQALGRPLLAGLKAAEIASLRIVEPGMRLTLERKDGGWTIAERAGFPADVAKVREFALKAIELKVAQSEAIAEATRARFQLADAGKEGAGTLVEFLAADGKPLGRIIAGRKYFRSEPGDAERAPADGRYLMRPEDPHTVYLASDPLVQASAKSADWIDRRSFAAENLRTLEVHFPDGGGWRIERRTGDTPWTLAGAKAGEKLDFARANAASYSLGILELADAAAPGATDAGLEKPVRVEATSFDGLGYAIRIGGPAGENYYVSFESSGAPLRERLPQKGEKPEDAARRDKEHAERIARIEERLPREKLLAGRVLLIAKSRLEDVLKKRSDLLEKKEARK